MSLSVHIEKKLGSFRLSVDLEHPGGITGLLGASGCGKSMTLKAIAGIEKPDRGRRGEGCGGDGGGEHVRRNYCPAVLYDDRRRRAWLFL